MEKTTEPRDLVGQTVRAIEALEGVIDEFKEKFYDFLETDWYDLSAKAGDKLDRLMVLCGKLERAVEILSPALKSYTDVVTEFVKTVRSKYDVCCLRCYDKSEFELIGNALKSQVERVFDGLEGDVLDKLCTNVYYIKNWYELPEEIIWNWEDYA